LSALFPPPLAVLFWDNKAGRNNGSAAAFRDPLECSPCLIVSSIQPFPIVCHGWNRYLSLDSSQSWSPCRHWWLIKTKRRILEWTCHVSALQLSQI
jgi:hypothetical protein